MNTNHATPKNLTPKIDAPKNDTSNTILLPAGRAHLLIERFAALLDFELTINQLVNEKIGRARFFENLHIGYCCGGGEKTLGQACKERDLEPQRVLEQLLEHDKNAVDFVPKDESLTAAIERITKQHHPWLRHELPRLEYLLARVANKHGHIYHELWDIQGAFEELREQVSSRIERHETQLFPLCAYLVEQYTSSTSQDFGRAAHFAQWNLGHMIESSQAERIFLCEAMQQIQSWTATLGTARSICTTLCVAISGLHELDVRLQQLFLDENILLQQTAKVDKARIDSAIEFAPSWMR